MDQAVKVTTFKNRFASLVDESEKTTIDLAKELHVSNQTISAWKNGTRSPKEPTIIAIADHFGVTVEWLMGFNVEKYAPSSGQEHFIPIFGTDNEKFVMLMKAMPFEDYKTFIDILRRAEQKLRDQGVKL